jgi:hypothetical protein
VGREFLRPVEPFGMQKAHFAGLTPFGCAQGRQDSYPRGILGLLRDSAGRGDPRKRAHLLKITKDAARIIRGRPSKSHKVGPFAGSMVGETGLPPPMG